MFFRHLRLIALGTFFLAAAKLHAQPGTPTPSQPTNGAIEIPTAADFLWRPVVGGISYEIELAFDTSFITLAYQDRISEYQKQIADLWPDTLYYWHVRAVDSLDSTSAWSEPQSFRTVVTGAPRPTTPVDGANDVRFDQATLGFTYPSTPPNGFETEYAFDAGFRGGVRIATSDKSVGLSILPADTTVYWRVRVAGGAAAGPGAWSRTMRFYTASTPLPQLGICTPIAPTSGIELEDLLISSVWSGPTPGAAPVRYHVQFSTDPTMREVAMNFEELDSTRVMVRMPAAAATWYWHVRALSTTPGLLDGPWSTVASFSIGERVGPALAVPLLQLPPNGSDNRGAKVTMLWDSVEGAASYELEVGRDTLFDTSDTVIATARRSTSVKGLMLETAYSWRVRALSDSGVGSWSDPFTFTTRTVDTILPGVPTPLAPDDEVRDLDPTLVFRWNPASDATAHLVQVSGDSTFAEGTYEFAAFDSTATGQLEEGRRWWWRVRGINEFGFGPWSRLRTFTTLVTTSAAPRTADDRHRTISITPIPASTSAQLVAQVGPLAEARVTVAGLRGDVVFDESFSADEGGRLVLNLPAAQIPPGVYRCRVISAGGEVLETPLVVTR